METSGQTKRIAVIPVDAVGKAVLEEAVNVLKAAAAAGKRGISLTVFPWNTEPNGNGSAVSPDFAVALNSHFDAVLIGPAGDPQSGSQCSAAIKKLKKELGLEVQLRPCLLLDKRATPLQIRSEKDVQFVVVSDATDDRNFQKLLLYGFECARRRKLTRIAIAQELSEALSAHEAAFIAESRIANPGIQVACQPIEHVIRGLVHDPTLFQVVLANGTGAAAIGALAEELAGGPGLTPVATIRRDGLSLFGPSGGITDANPVYVNPVGASLSVAWMFEHFGWDPEAKAVRDAVRASLHEQQATPDIAGQLTTHELGSWLASATLIRSRSC